MELWIRSQDKERLIKPIDFYLEEDIDYVNKSSEFDIYALNLANEDIRIGIYKTEERALEVLDEIMLRIHQLNMFELGVIRVFDGFTTIYEMPIN